MPNKKIPLRYDIFFYGRRDIDNFRIQSPPRTESLEKQNKINPTKQIHSDNIKLRAYVVPHYAGGGVLGGLGDTDELMT